ncbi:MAG: DoxX family protein [Streptosporangiaceae bacterium]
MTNLAGVKAAFFSSRTRTVAYWGATVLVVGELLLGGVWDILLTPGGRETMTQLGYPAYFAVIMGVWKVPGAAALLAPRFPRLKEWAYAGAIFTYTGAAASHLAVGQGAATVVLPLIFVVLAAASWALRPPNRRDRTPRAGIYVEPTPRSTPRRWART